MNFKNYKYTDKEKKELLNSIIILIDTREKEFSHISNYFDNKKIQYLSMAHDFADYSFYVPTNKELGIYRDVYFYNEVIIERKNSLEELSQNFAQNRERFENEWLRSGNCKKLLLIENCNVYSDIILGRYNTELKSNAFLASLLAFQHRYNIDIVSITKDCAGQFIYSYFYYWLRNQL